MAKTKSVEFDEVTVDQEVHTTPAEVKKTIGQKLDAGISSVSRFWHNNRKKIVGGALALGAVAVIRQLLTGASPTEATPDIDMTAEGVKILGGEGQLDVPFDADKLIEPVATE